jgi:AcrR family transcriptional regulator
LSKTVPIAPAAPRFCRRPEARAEELVEAAIEVFGEHGFRAATLEEVARRAGVSKGTVYLYFTSKEDLFRAMVEKKIIPLIEAGEASARDHTGASAELLDQMIRRLWEAMSRPDMVRLARVVQAELNHFPELRRLYFERVIQRQRRLLRSIAERGVAAGEFRPEAVTVVPMIVPSLILQLNQYRFLFGDLDQSLPTSDAARELVLALVLDGIRLPPRAARGKKG